MGRGRAAGNISFCRLGHNFSMTDIEAAAETSEIPLNEWAAFPDSFSRQHEGWLVSIFVTEGAREISNCEEWPLGGDHCRSSL
jgi:hypothetical protein